MSVYLIKTDETYRADSEEEATNFITEAKEDGRFILAKYTAVKKEQKAKGEIIDEWYRVTLTKVFDSEKEPCGSTTIEYINESAF